MYVRRALVLAFALAALAPAARAAPAQTTSMRGPSQWAVLVGLEDGNGDTGFQLRGDLVFSQRPLSPMVGFAIVGQLGFSRFTNSGGYYDAISGIDTRWDSSLNLFKFGGSARFTFGNHPMFQPYAEGGLGVYYGGFSGSQTVYAGYPYGYVSQDYSSSDVNLFMHLAGGVSMQMNPNFSLGLEVGFNPYFGDVDQTLTSLLASATFRM